MTISEKKMQIVIDNYFKSECDINTNIRQAFEKGFRIGVKKGQYSQTNTEKWIPVSKRTPAKEETYACLVTVEEDDIFGEPQRVVYPEYVGYDGETWVDASGKEIPFEVIAWMPRPTPYKENEE